MNSQLPLFPDLTTQFPSTRYQGSKAKLAAWIWEQIAEFEFQTCLDAFGGTGAVAYRLKQAGKSVTYNDVLKFNYCFGKALIENATTRLEANIVDWLLTKHQDIPYPNFVQRTFHDIYFTDEENAWIDTVITNIHRLTDPYQQALAFFALAQACIIKRPYNLFHRKNLYLRLADVERSFGNKASWDKSFEAWFRHFAQEANQAIFDNGRPNHALNRDAFNLTGDYDLVYIDTPYISHKGVGIDYRDFYHFLEGLTIYDQWDTHVDYASKHRRLKRKPRPWTDKARILEAFDRLFAHFQSSMLVISYRSDGIPSIAELEAALNRYKESVIVRSYGQYQYALSTVTKSHEVLLIGT